MGLPDPADQPLVVEQVVGAVPPGTITMSGSGRSSNAASAMQPQLPGVGARPARLVREPGQLGAGDALDHLVGADGVERGEAVVERDRDPS